MKRLLSCLLIFLFVLSSTSCMKKEEESTKVNAFEIETATNVVESYMGFIMKGDYENGKKLYTKELMKKTPNMPISDIKIKGYKVTETNEVGRSGVFKVRVTRTSIEKPLSCLDEYSIKVVKDGAEYKVNEITSSPEKEAFVESIGIRFRDKKNVKTNLIIDKSGLPKYTYSNEDAAKLYKMLVPIKQYSSINFSYEGDKLAISTYDKNSFIGIVYIDESLAVAANPSSSTEQSGGTEGSGVMAKEKPIGKELIPLDLLIDCKVEFMTFSLDEKFLLVQYDKGKEGKYIRVYEVDNGDMISVDFEKDYPSDKVDILFSSFGEDSMTYEVVSKSNISGAETDIVGKWKLDLKEFTVDKL
ncbi:hypothetical protein [Clostridium lacusfryxellense]|uniref:hypothetical protein n=1 Tax=Clostridium lacusfryxellense TaxID=205328 RepID=UPI001C0CECFE|nr:hypothetical protein [Clostridium lacusfryxellense]MBU3110610.1 hypothetical protein [Clostridium lacusfryxellense]